MPQDRFHAEDDGVDIIIDCTGVPIALESAVPWTKMGATILVFGCAPVGKTLRVCPEEIFAKELTILGTKINPYTYSEAVTLVGNMGQKYMSFEKLGIGVYTLDKFEDALETLKKGKISKIMFELEDWFDVANIWAYSKKINLLNIVSCFLGSKSFYFPSNLS